MGLCGFNRYRRAQKILKRRRAILINKNKKGIKKNVSKRVGKRSRDRVVRDS